MTSSIDSRAPSNPVELPESAAWIPPPALHLLIALSAANKPHDVAGFSLSGWPRRLANRQAPPVG